MNEEFSRWGQRFPGIGAEIIAREEQEYAAADIITVPSSFAARSFMQMGVPPKKLRTIPYGVDVRRFRKLSDPPKERFDVLFVGAVSFQKGIPYLLRAFELVKHPRKRLRVIGAVQDEMARFLRGRHFDAVDFLGTVPQSDLAPIINSSHVFVLPSIQDGFGMVLNQAMACGCPVICSTNTAAEDLVEHGKEGFIVPIRDQHAIAIRLQQLCDDRDLRLKLAEASLRRVHHANGWAQYGDQFGALCRTLSRAVCEQDVLASLNDATN
jgi:glycosyltransferase involved in cell wall biosynthesis